MEKHCHAHHHNKFFKSFLVVYLIFSVMALFEHNFASSAAISGIIAGFALAIIAHKRYGLLTVALLLVHMFIERFEHSLHWREYSTNEIALHGMHVALDFIFLFQELRAHAFKIWKPTFGVVIAVILTMILINFNATLTAGVESTSNILIEAFVVGGMYGWILSHLFKREKCVESKTSI